MIDREIEDFVMELDKRSAGLCVYPDKQTIDCCDCYLCRVDFFEQVRADLRKEQYDKNRSNQQYD